MANSKISDLTAVGSISAATLFEVVQTSDNFKASGATCKAYFSDGLVSGSAGAVGQIPVSNSAGTGFSFSSTFFRDNTSNNFYVGTPFTNTNTGTKNNNFIFMSSNQLLGTGNIRWAASLSEQLIINAAGGLIHNPGGFGGFNNTIKTNGAFQSFSCAHFSCNACLIEAVTASTTSSSCFVGRNCTILNASCAMASGYRAKVTKNGAYGHGFATTFTGGGSHTGTVQECLSDGLHSFAFFANSTSSVVGEGALADYCAILGGVDPNIPSDSPRHVLLGGNGLKARATRPDYTTVHGIDVNNGDVVLYDSSKGIILKSATNNKYFRLYIDAADTLQISDLGTSLPT
jgi:hypothetical protein